jgi:anti-sigma-K factor RskA
MELNSQESRLRAQKSRWRAAAIAGLLVLTLAAAASVSMFEQFTAQVRYLQQQLKGTPQIKYIAVLLDDKNAPALLVTLDPQDTALEIQRLNDVREGREDAMQLWALAPGAKPYSLGVLQSAATTLRLPATEGLLAHVTSLAISVENKGGAEVRQGPRLPYLLTGSLVQKAR